MAPSEQGIAGKQWVRSRGDSRVAALVKWAHAPGAEYSIGMERLAYQLGTAIGLPVPITYLEDYEGKAASVQLRVKHPKQFDQAQASPLLWNGIEDRESWPLGVAFDLWVANLDRRAPNILIEPIPPEKLAQVATAGRTWFIDNGLGGLWYPQKVDPSLGNQIVSVDRLTMRQVKGGAITADASDRLRGRMPIEYRRSFSDRDPAHRRAFLDQIGAIPDDLLEAAVREVPDRYFSDRAAEMTLAFLRGRRDTIYTLSSDVFPSA
jgi:hypothetical protein